MKIRILNALVLSVFAIIILPFLISRLYEFFHLGKDIFLPIYGLCIILPEILLIIQQIFYPKSLKKPVRFILKTSYGKILFIISILVVLYVFISAYMEYLNQDPMDMIPFCYDCGECADGEEPCFLG